ncbi:RNA ligase (ATP) [Chitinimonas lacunae]|uniref:RNA ligase (ATP) n=1 Tax=Chitinimonas lacunae TaxID=1963018 RepID=A0ABV8MMX8_9NEIS
MRKLVTVRRVDKLTPIPGADAIECATIEGWQVVVKKAEFQPGDFCVYFEIDAFLPLDDPRYQFLVQNRIVWEGREGVRLRTLKLRGQLSQGLILPLLAFPEISAELNKLAPTDWREHDFSALLGIEKWEAPIPAEMAGEVEGPFPAYLRKTDQERVQNLPGVLYEQADLPFEVTVKLDGASMTVFRHGDEQGVCGRNWWLKETRSNTLWRVARQDRLLEALAVLDRNLALQGELIGEGIQGNPEKLRGQQFRLYDVFDIDRGLYLGHEQRLRLVDQLNAAGATLSHVPVLEITTLARFNGEMAAVLDYAEGPSLNPATRREGVVFKRLDGDFSFKAIANSYLLKHGDR